MIEIISGAYLFRGGLSIDQQEKLVELYHENKNDFYRPKPSSGKYMSLMMTCFGHHWSAMDYKYHNTREDADKEPVKPMPEFFQAWACPFSLASFKDEKAEWDVCIANYYRPGSRLGMHSDNSETQESLQGKPVVSFSVGADCIFKFGGKYRNDPHKEIRLFSGDVFIFGGEVRKNYHGIEQVFSGDNIFNEDLDGGRLNFTLRKL